MSNLLYIFVMAGTTYLIRVLPMTLIKKPIKSRFIRSFLFYVPYVTLAVMTFPAIMDTAGSTLAGILSMAVGILLAWFGVGLLPVAVSCCVIVFLAGLL